MIEDELTRFFSVAKRRGGWEYYLFVIIANLGLRISEGLALTRQSFKELNRGIVLVRSLKQRMIHGSDNREDTIAVDDSTRAFIQNYLNKLPKNQEALFLNSNGGPINRSTAWRHFVRCVVDAKLNLVYTPHALRHSRGVKLWESSRDLQFVRSQLRHRSLSSTSIYIHMSPQLQKEMVAKVKPVF